MTWMSITGLTDDGWKVTHVIPCDDLWDHSLDSGCWCCPTFDEEHWVATHQSADGREAFENGERKPS
jgi:hypothetical protein